MGININLSSCYIYSCGVVSSKEEASYISSYLDYMYKDAYAGEKTYEKGEETMLKSAIKAALDKVNLSKNDLDYIIGGDLSNQIYLSNSVASLFNIPFIGVYGACSTSLLAIGVGCLLLELKQAKFILTYTSSNEATAERQFRYPTSYGIEKKPTATSTVNGAVSVIITHKKTKIQITSITFGKVIDSLSTNLNDMGSIMALAAFDTIIKHLQARKEHLKDYDLILTGDLSKVGKAVLTDMLKTESEDIDRLMDAGEFIYLNHQGKQSGGSGPACLPLVGFSLIINKLKEKALKKVLFVATGSLHNKISTLQKNTIPVIAHALTLIRSEE